MATRSSKTQPASRNKTQPKSKLPVLDARRDTLDFRDKMYVPTLIEVPLRVGLEQYLEHQIPILNQGTEGA